MPGSYTYTPYMWLLLVPVVLAACLMGIGWRYREQLSGRLFTALSAAICLWSLTYVLQILAVDLPTKLFWNNFKYFGLVLVCPLWLAIALVYTQRQIWLKSIWLRLLFGLQLLPLALVWTNDWHHLWFQQVWVLPGNTWGEVQATYGLVFWLVAALIYFSAVAAEILYLDFYLNASPFYRRQTAMLILAGALPVAGDLLYLFGKTPTVSGFNLITLLFATSGLIVAYALFRHHLLDLAPIARQAVIEQVLDGVVVVDDLGRIADINLAARRLFRSGDREVVGQSLSQAGENLALLAALSKALMMEGARPFTTAIECQQDGRPLALDVSMTEFTDTEKHRLGQIVVLHDVSEHKQLQALMARLMRMAAHDLRTPLSLAVGYLSLLDDQPVPEPSREWVQIACGALQQMEGLINDLLDLERMRSGVGMRRETIQPAALARQVYGDLEPLARAKSQQLCLQIEPELPGLQGDSRLLQQSLANLVSNAIQYTPENGLIIVRVHRHGDHVTYLVADDGPGIPDEAQDGLFRSFHRGQNGDSAGLGLSLVKAIIEGHGGQVLLQSKPGKGSTFGFSLPIDGYLQL